jgi:hypothetical protein
MKFAGYAGVMICDNVTRVCDVIPDARTIPSFDIESAPKILTPSVPSDGGIIRLAERTRMYCCEVVEIVNRENRLETQTSVGCTQ